MKNTLMSVTDKIMMRKRALIESVNDELKNIAQIEHSSRHRSFENFITKDLSAIATYCFSPKTIYFCGICRLYSAHAILILYRTHAN